MNRIPYRPLAAYAIAALLSAAVWHGAAQAADPVPDYMLYYSGERDFCLCLLKNADKAVKFEPVIGPTLTFDIDQRELYASRRQKKLTSTLTPSWPHLPIPMRFWA